MNMSALDNFNTQVRVRYKLIDQYGVESSEYEVSFRFSVAPSNGPPVEPSGTSSCQEHVDYNIPDNKPGTNEDERAPDPANAEWNSVTGTGNGIELAPMIACRQGLMTTFKRYQSIFDLVIENGRPRPRPPANQTRAFPAHSLVSTMTTA